MTRWTHGHSIAAGVAGGLILDRHSFLVLLAGVIVGVLARELARVGRIAAALSHRAAAAAAALAEEKVKTEKARASELRTRTRHRRRTKQEQDKAVKHAYIEGAIDGGRT